MNRHLDANKKKSSQEGYDPTTLYIPESAFKDMSPCMKQFWSIKQTNYDKIVLMKLGKFYELFYDDAYIGHKYLDLKWMGAKMHTGFPEKSLEKHAITLVNLGFKICVVEQTEVISKPTIRTFIILFLDCQRTRNKVIRSQR